MSSEEVINLQTYYVKKTDIIDNLTTDDTIKPLSAKQGKILQDNKVDKENGKSLFSGSYNDLINKPNIPTKTSDLTNDSDFIASSDIQISADKVLLDSATKTYFENQYPDQPEGTFDYQNSFNSMILSSKVDKVGGKQLSSNDYTDTEKNKLANIEEEANKTVVVDTITDGETKPVSSNAVYDALQKGLKTYKVTSVNVAGMSLVYTVDNPPEAYPDVFLLINETNADISGRDTARLTPSSLTIYFPISYVWLKNQPILVVKQVSENRYDAIILPKESQQILDNKTTFNNLGTLSDKKQSTINAAIDTKLGTLSTVAISGKSSDLDNDAGFLTSHQSLSNIGGTVTIEKATSNIGNNIARYTIKQGGTTLTNGVIDIPKDFLVKSGTVHTVGGNATGDKTASQLGIGYSTGDKYIDFVINTKENDGAEEHIYINVKDLVESTVTISGNLTSGTKIGTITINGVSTDLYCETNTDTTYNLANGITNGLSSNDFTSSYKNALDGLSTTYLTQSDASSTYQPKGSYAISDHNHGKIMNDGTVRGGSNGLILQKDKNLVTDDSGYVVAENKPTLSSLSTETEELSLKDISPVTQLSIPLWDDSGANLTLLNLLEYDVNDDSIYYDGEEIANKNDIPAVNSWSSKSSGVTGLTIYVNEALRLVDARFEKTIDFTSASSYVSQGTLTSTYRPVYAVYFSFNSPNLWGMIEGSVGTVKIAKNMTGSTEVKGSAMWHY